MASLPLLLSAALAASSWANTVVAPITSQPGGLGGAAAVGVVPGGLLKSLDLHLEQTSLRLGPSLPTLALPKVEPAPELEKAQARAVVEYLSRAALATPLESAGPSPQAQAAKVLAQALADPQVRERVAGELRRAGQEAQAERLESLAEHVSRSPLIRQLARDLSWDGASPASADEFVSYAGRRFVPGRAAAVSAPKDQELYDEVALSPLTNAERERVVKELFIQAGAAAEDVRLQDTGDGTHNLYVVKKGRTDRVLVVGAHHDKVSAGNGTIDNWAGAALVTNLFQALKDVATEATVIFVAFSKEERGLVGSREFVKRLSREELSKVDAMVNFDVLGVDGTYSWQNNSDKRLLERIKKAAAEAKLALKEMTLWGGDADSSSFRRAGVPAMTVLGVSSERVWDIVHSANDTIAAFSLPHYKNAYLLSLELLKRLDAEPVGRRLWAWLKGLIS